MNGLYVFLDWFKPVYDYSRDRDADIELEFPALGTSFDCLRCFPGDAENRKTEIHNTLRRLTEAEAYSRAIRFHS
jgi:hypothetical protein